MTVVITPYRLKNFHDVSDGGDFLLPHGWSEFDSSVHIGNDEFVVHVRFIPHAGLKLESGVLLVRPSDFEQARDWVLDSSAVNKIDKPKLLDLLNAVEDDKDVYLNFSW